MDNEIQQNIPPIQPLPQVPVTPSANYSKLLLFTMLGLIVVTGAVFAGIQIGKNQKTRQQPITEQPTILPTQVVVNPTTIPTTIWPTEPNPSINPTADWKTYANTKFNYEIKYPEQFIISETGMGGGDIKKAFGISVYMDNKIKIEESPRFTLNVRQDEMDFKDFTSQHFNKVSTFKLTESQRINLEKDFGFVIDKPEVIEPLIKTTLYGLGAYTYTIKGNFVDNGSEETLVPVEIRKYVWLQRNGLYLLISFTDIAPLNQILSTFKFTN